MKEYERPIVSIINFSAEAILDDTEIGDGLGSMEEGVGGGW